MITEKILNSLKTACGFDFSEPLVVGLSGGPDSLCLVHCLHEAGVEVIAGHLDHNLRPTSSEEAASVAALMRLWKVPCSVEKTDVGQIARMLRMGIEEAARITRYQFLFRLASRYGAKGVAVAHNADDQVETVLMHFLRGAGIQGLKGIQPKSYLKTLNPHIPVLRPMLDVFRDEILQYCEENALPYLTDESNANTTFFRNRLRMEVIPALEKVNPAFRRVTLRNAVALQSDLAVLEKAESLAYSDCVSSADKFRISFNGEKFAQLDPGLQRRLFIRAANFLRPNIRNIGWDQVERVLQLTRSDGGKTNFIADLEVWVDAQSVQVMVQGSQPDFPDLPQMKSEIACLLQPGSAVDLSDGWQLHAEICDGEVYRSLTAEQKTDQWHAWINPADTEFPLSVRPARVGERWAPYGLNGKHQKLSDFFINNKIPQSARAKWPLVVNEGSIVWVAGLRIGQAWRLFGDEHEVVHLFLSKPTPEYSILFTNPKHLFQDRLNCRVVGLKHLGSTISNKPNRLIGG